MRDRHSRTRGVYGCGLAVVALLAVAVALWSAGGLYGLLHLSKGRNPWRYVSPTPERRAQTIAHADEIIAALERWKGKHGEYPESLAALVPSELAALPQSTIGDRKWKY